MNQSSVFKPTPHFRRLDRIPWCKHAHADIMPSPVQRHAVSIIAVRPYIYHKTSYNTKSKGRMLFRKGKKAKNNTTRIEILKYLMLT